MHWRETRFGFGRTRESLVWQGRLAELSVLGRSGRLGEASLPTTSECALRILAVAPIGGWIVDKAGCYSGIHPAKLARDPRVVLSWSSCGPLVIL